MAPAILLPFESSEPHLEKRQYRCTHRNAYGQCVRANNYGRWIGLGVALFAFFLFLILAFWMSHRRRKRGMMPIYGTRWVIKPTPAARKQHEHNQELRSDIRHGNVDNAAWPPTNSMSPPPPQYTTSPYQNDYAPPSGPPPPAQEYFPPPNSPPPAHTNAARF
ncbi:hypothetical protein BJ508DRAFT_372687 [Ascobolus immersus RN42]|uniref:Uncharacterized protein n=1 Tax=Ascobolus immersus RN42 TaxID=1160509 RepID=A0A3N4INV6_ASCIM|nr:hypothetical protein BJ508DRAFT_372687 [Ascobolus immersus RN42]